MAGPQPSDRVSPVVTEAMRAAVLDVRDRKPKVLIFQMLESADRVITMSCAMGNACPAGFVTSEEWQIEDLERESLERVGQVRDQIRARVRKLAEEIASGNGRIYRTLTAP